jgi:hypothetical protein
MTSHSTHGPARRRTRLARAFYLSASIALVVVIAAETVFFWNYLEEQQALTLDYRWFVGIAERWLETGQLFAERQLTGPYEVLTLVDFLYPPVALLLFLPFIWLPAFLWWLIPLGVFTYCIVRLRPARWTWPLILACIAWPQTISQILYGNTNMWVAAAVAAGVVWAWPSVLVLLKPSLLPFALVGINHRSWWLALGVLVLVSIPFGGLWPDYLTAMRNSDLGPFHALRTIPFFLAPLIAWVGRTRDDSRGPQLVYSRIPWPRQSQISTTSRSESSSER